MLSSAMPHSAWGRARKTEVRGEEEFPFESIVLKLLGVESEETESEWAREKENTKLVNSFRLSAS